MLERRRLGADADEGIIKSARIAGVKKKMAEQNGRLKIYYKQNEPNEANMEMHMTEGDEVRLRAENDKGRYGVSESFIPRAPEGHQELYKDSARQRVATNHQRLDDRGGGEYVLSED